MVKNGGCEPLLTSHREDPKAALPTGALVEALNLLARVLQHALVGLAVLVMAQPSPLLVLPNCLVYLRDEGS